MLFMLNCRLRWVALRCCRCGGLARGMWAKGWAADLQSWISLFVRWHQDCVAVAAEDWPTPSPGHLPDWGHARIVYKLKTTPAASE